MWMKTTIEALFGLALFINAVLFIPQAYRIFQKKEAKEISLITFVGFCLIQLVAVAYGYIRQDNILLYGYLLSLLTCASVVVLTLFYRNK